MKFHLLPAILIAVTLSIATSKIVYFGFSPNYYFGTRISKNLFHSQFDHDVFQYRLLSKSLLLMVDEWLDQSHQATVSKNPALSIVKDSSEQFYYAYFYLNTFFLCLTSILLVLLLRMDRLFSFTEQEKFLLLFLSIIIINLSQFALYYYDISSYFFQLLILYTYLTYSKEKYFVTITAICLLIFLSTLNRESSALSVSLIAMLIFLQSGISRLSILGITLVSISFLGTYMALRYIIIDPLDRHFIYNDAGHLLYDINITGMIFWILFFLLPFEIARNVTNKWLILFYHIASLPYIITCFKVGVLWEIRLYVPLFLGSIFLSKLDAADFKIQPKMLFARLNGLKYSNR